MGESRKVPKKCHKLFEWPLKMSLTEFFPRLFFLLWEERKLAYITTFEANEIKAEDMSTKKNFAIFFFAQYYDKMIFRCWKMKLQKLLVQHSTQLDSRERLICICTMSFLFYRFPSLFAGVTFLRNSDPRIPKPSI